MTDRIQPEGDLPVSAIPSERKPFCRRRSPRKPSYDLVGRVAGHDEVAS
ncbi:MAG: hypothetical protein NZ808_10500 [Myxococcota bacterium]|nr:hypothetical protein [Myxococcota bacterium]